MVHTNHKKQRRRRKNITTTEKKPKFLSYGGNLRILQEKECEDIHGAVLDILSDIGISHASNKTHDIAVNNGVIFKNGRLYFPKSLTEDAISALSRPITLNGHKSENDLQITGTEIYFGTGGATPTILDHKTNQFRETTLKDLYENACLIEQLENVDFFSRTVIARDLKTQRELDLNTAFACLRGTTKHIMISITHSEDIKSIVEMLEDIHSLNSKVRQKKLISLNTNHIVSPLRFDPKSCDVLIEGVKSGLPINVNTFAQVGASTAVTLAGAIAQTIAETMAGMILGYLVDKNATLIFGPRPMITDLRTGSISGGSAEQPIATAMAGQMAQYYGLANSAISGATDSKSADAQSSFEKTSNIQMAAFSGVNLITQSCGSLASLMATSFTASVIDNDMLGIIRRSCGKLEINKNTLGLESIKKVIDGEGHFLGQPETYDRMRSDYLYPTVSNRKSWADWEADGAPNIANTAKARVDKILTNYEPSHIEKKTIKAIQNKYNLANF